jgi:predicted 3-demethylubiquinone-9 3-methyltransferase (glyoxalase superfamily)
VTCEDQGEVDRYWDRLTEGGDPAAQQCGWIKDRFGVSWQIIPDGLVELVSDPASERSQRAMKAMLSMKKLDIHKLRRAYDGGSAT